MKFKINCYITEIPNWLKEIKIKKNDEYLDIVDDFGNINLMLQVNGEKINLEELKKIINFKKPYYIWIDKDQFYYEKFFYKEQE
jgi:hypothetical protein